MKKRLIVALIVVCFVGSCSPVTGSPTPPPAATTTTIIPSPTPTPIPETREHLIVTRNHEHLAVFNPDGSLQKYIEMPMGTFVGQIEHAISPDGNWLVYESGSYKEPHDLSLNLLNLDEETSWIISNLVSPEFPTNIGPIVETMSQYDQSLYGGDCTSIECRRSLVEDDLLTNVGVYDWSPNGQELAFAAQIDGPSSDIYIYNLQDKTIRRLTNDLQNILRIVWSPDGKWILYSNNMPGINVLGSTFHITDMQGRASQLSMPNLSVRDGRWVEDGWMSEHHFLFYGLYHEHPQFRRLMIFDAENRQLSEIWSHVMKDYVVDINTQTVVLLFESENDPNLPQSGVYRISTDGKYERIGNPMFYHLTASPQIVGKGVEKAYHITSDNSINLIGPALSGLTSVSSSPDKKWFFIDDFVNARQRFTLYSDTYQQIRSWMFNDDLIRTVWRPDSLGLFLFTDENIYYLDIPDGEPSLLHAKVPPMSGDCGSVTCIWPSFAWRP